MGNVQKIDSCFFTGLKVEPIIDDKDRIEYYVKIGSKKHQIALSVYSSNWEKDFERFRKNKHILRGLLYNNKWVKDETQIINEPVINQLLDRYQYPTSPEEKKNNLMLLLASIPEEDGAKVDLHTSDLNLWQRGYFKSKDEFEFYMRALYHEGLIGAEFYTNTDSPLWYKITFKGLNYLIKIQSEGAQSNKCFIAMSFRSDMESTRLSIKKALAATGFTPIIVDEDHVNSDTSINDHIIASLKKCNFCIADFTHHSKGVYFESGFALGQGKKVIYTCLQDDFDDAHFDIKPLQHIIYESPEDLQQKLIDKIEAWIL
ncbi:DUF4062 domain-containing protein [bacterium]|nr:DUF4062 domain-containing protein [bacterium]